MPKQSNQAIRNFKKRWRGMLDRCHNPHSPFFIRYGGRGITVCEHWRIFENFFQDMWPIPFDGASLDRIDNDKGYFKENCRWATRSEQQLNQRTRVTCKTAITGVCRRRRDGWRAYAQVAGKQISLYEGQSFADAVSARKLWEKENMKGKSL